MKNKSITLEVRVTDTEFFKEFIGLFTDVVKDFPQDKKDEIVSKVEELVEKHNYDLEKGTE